MRLPFTILLCAATILASESTGRRAPGFALPDSQMNFHDLADYRGKVVLIDFTQTDCPHCATFAPILNQVQQQYAGKVVILAVVNGAHDNAPKVAAYIAGHQITYPVLFDSGQMEYSYVRKPTVDNPCLYLIDGNGVIRNDWSYGPFAVDIFEGKGLFREIDRVLNANFSAAPKK
ncbi:MAG: TlpA disulfide reductase family protein [Bryobacteraceae bacterium]|jgi:peroxiredoxin